MCKTHQDWQLAAIGFFLVLLRPAFLLFLNTKNCMCFIHIIHDQTEVWILHLRHSFSVFLLLSTLKLYIQDIQQISKTHKIIEQQNLLNNQIFKMIGVNFEEIILCNVFSSFVALFCYDPKPRFVHSLLRFCRQKTKQIVIKGKKRVSWLLTSVYISHHS